MIKIGITGGISSGKTTAATFLKEKGSYIFNADQQSKAHLKKSLVLQKKSAQRLQQRSKTITHCVLRMQNYRYPL